MSLPLTVMFASTASPLPMDEYSWRIRVAGSGLTSKSTDWEFSGTPSRVCWFG
jgi:hypothetical protein